MKIANREIGNNYPPLVIAEIGINHEGSYEKAIKMVDDAHDGGCECVKFQCHILEDEMIPNKVIPGNATETIWEIIKRCTLSEKEEVALKNYVEEKGMIYLSTPFSRAAADRLQGMGVDAFKIGSGECNNYPLLNHIAQFGKPVVLSTGMNDLQAVKKSVSIFKKHNIPFALMHCTSMYPTPHEKVRLVAMQELMDVFPLTPIGLSDHSLGNYTCFAAAALGASVLEKHFTSDKNWDGPDIPISISPDELSDLIYGSNAIFRARGGRKSVLKEEQPTIDFAYASVVSIKEILPGDELSYENLWVKRPGTGEILAEHFENLIGRKATNKIAINSQLKWSDLEL